MSSNRFWGGILSVGQNQITDENKFSDANGKQFSLGVVVKKRLGSQWLVGLSTYYNADKIRISRDLQLHTKNNLASRQHIQNFGARLQALYTVDYGDWYLRPSVNFDLNHTHASSYREPITSFYALEIFPGKDTTVSLTSGIEIKSRVNVKNAILRPYAKLAFTYNLDDYWEQEARFVHAPAGMPSVKTKIARKRTVRRAQIGMEYIHRKTLELRIYYDRGWGNKYRDHNVITRIGYRF